MAVSEVSNETKRKFEEKVMIWKIMQEMFDGWDGLAEYLSIPKDDLQRYAIQDIVAYGESLGLSFKESEKDQE